MKYSVAVATLALATGVLAKPKFTNSEIAPKEGKPFTLTLEGCDDGCTITVEQGPDSNSLKTVKTLTCESICTNPRRRTC